MAWDRDPGAHPRLQNFTGSFWSFLAPSHHISGNLLLHYRTYYFVMPLNLLEDTQSQAELDNWRTTPSIKSKKGKGKKKIWKEGCWLKHWAGTQQQILFLILHHIRLPSQKVRITTGFPHSPKLVYLEGFF